MKKIIKKLGNSTVIIITKDDKRIYNLKEGDVIELELVRVQDCKLIKVSKESARQKRGKT